MPRFPKFVAQYQHDLFPSSNQISIEINDITDEKVLVEWLKNNLRLSVHSQRYDSQRCEIEIKLEVKNSTNEIGLEWETISFERIYV